MNTAQLERFATSTRRKLLEQVGSKLRYVLTHDAVELRAKQAVLSALRRKVEEVGEDALIDQVAYTWFNRLVALRFMDVNGYQPIGKSVVTPHEGGVVPALLQDAQGGDIASDLQVDRDRIFKLLTGQEPSNNADNEAYRLLLVAACNHLHTTLPFLFEGIDDYAELLLPDDLSSPLSVVHDVVQGMASEDCAEVEVIGWLYQFYISELNEKLIQSKKAYKKDELAPATQLFTPNWIVRYMVDNTLGRMWMSMHPNSDLKDRMEFYITPEEPEHEEAKSLEAIKMLEPCVGSGHILSYAFDLFYAMYEEEGYAPSDIPGLILKHNLTGLDIDPRAAQLAALVLMFKGRGVHRRFFVTASSQGIQPAIEHFEDFEESEEFRHASALGALIKPIHRPRAAQGATDLFVDRTVEKRTRLFDLLTAEYDVVVTNPPYVNSKRLPAEANNYVREHYPESKSDLYGAIIQRCEVFLRIGGYCGFLSPNGWMFNLKWMSFRHWLMDSANLESLILFEFNSFPSAKVQICSWCMRKGQSHHNGVYFDLRQFRGWEMQRVGVSSAIDDVAKSWRYHVSMKHYVSSPQNIFSFWVSSDSVSWFSKLRPLGEEFEVRQGMGTSNNGRFLRRWFELSFAGVGGVDYDCKWRYYNKGGDLRRWYGNRDFVLNWGLDGREVKSEVMKKYPYLKSPGFVIKNESCFFKPSVSWSKISSSFMAVREYESDFIFDVAGCSIFGDDGGLAACMLLLNSRVGSLYLVNYYPTMNIEVGAVGLFPWNATMDQRILMGIRNNVVAVSQKDWDAHETSWDFKRNELIRIGGAELEDAYQGFVEHWTDQFLELHRLEEENNRYFIDLYDLQDELTPDVPLEEITILQQDEVDRKSLAGFNGSLERDGESGLVSTYEGVELPFKADAVMEQFVSYAVGCMFGRYSLDKPGLVLCNAGDTLEDFLEKVGMEEAALQFVPDDDNVIPVLDEAWFEDDIVGRFKTFLQVTFGEDHFHRNLAFVEASLGKDIRKYFVKDFWKDHLKRYDSRPIYWLFASPKKHFQALVYVHRYTPDTLNRMLNSYVREYIGKLEQHREQLRHQLVGASARDEARLRKELDKLAVAMKDVQDYETETLYPLAVKRIELDLDDGVYVNINRFGAAIPKVTSLNDVKARKKVKAFDWCDTTNIEA